MRSDWRAAKAAQLQSDPVWFAERALGVYLWSKQRAVIESVRDNRRIAVRSGHGIGKTFIAATTLLWFIYSFPNSRVITTATTWSQVQDLLWHEVNDLHRNARTDLGGEVLQTRLKLPGGRFAVGLSAAPERKESFQGHHAENLLLIFDEASGIPRPIFEAGEGYMTSAGAKQLLIGNPTQPAGDFFDAFHSARASYATHTISVLDSPAFTGEDVPEDVLRRLPSHEFVEDAEVRWGKDSPMFQVRVLGQFPTQSDDTVMALLDVEEAQKRTVAPTLPFVVSCDVARFGCHDDRTEILTDKGWKPFADLDGAEHVLSRHDDGTAAWEPITEIHRYRHDGEMVLYDGERLNFCVTENHRMLAASPHQGRSDYAGVPTYRLRRWDECPAEFIAPREVRWEGVHPGSFTFVSSREMPNGGERRREWMFSAEDWFSFLGWFISEGNVYHELRDGGRARVCIAQAGPHMTTIKRLLDRMGICFRTMPDGRQVEFSIRSIADHLDRECGHGAAHKRIPRYVLDAPPVLLERFMDAYCDGDGWRRDGRRLGYGTTSRQIADGLQEILVKLGRAGTLSTGHGAGSVTTIEGRTVVRDHDGLLVTETKRTRPATIAKRRTETIPYDGFVYCVSTPHHTILTRRNGCVLWAGNSDETVIAVRKGNWCRVVEKHHGQDTMQTAGAIIRVAQQNPGAKIVVDDDGLGGGVTDRLKELGHRVTPFRAGASPIDKQGYPNARSEMWFSLSERMPELDLDPDDQLAADLTAPKYKLDSQGRRVVEPKAETKKRLGRSPDRADAVLMAFWEGQPKAPTATMNHPWR